MQYLRKLKKLFLYAGVGKEEYDALCASIHEENWVLLNVFSQLAGIVYFLLFIASLRSSDFASVNARTYLMCGIVMVAIFFIAHFYVPEHPSLVMGLVYLFEIILYVFSINISMLHADKPAVSAVAFLLVSPLLFYDRPVRLSALIVADVAAVSLLVVRYKQPDVAEADVWNMVTFGIVAVATTLFIMKIKIRALAQSRQIEHLCQADLLTGTKNRNHYEKQLQKYPGMCTSNLVCVYGDVNGLHEVNNLQGHQAGDRMLCDVAAAIQERFGSEHTYRIGGDEFVAFQMDARPEEVASKIERMNAELAGEGYHVSFGSAIREKEKGPINMDELVKEAEERMFLAKREFYRQPEHNRRKR
ncbi:MAG: GGDEF domain-containing protein [Lachnospiraceae bacterium]|nr:GGDEF domain-containing protein [Lachnospiraceae bacterium]